MKTVDSIRPTRYAGRHMRFLSLTLAAVLACIAGAAAQSSASGGTVSTLGVITPGHCASFATPTSIQDAGTCGTGTGNVSGTGLTAGQPVLGGGGSTIANGAINLAGGTSFVTGILPNLNLPATLTANTNGNAATATALATLPTLCSAGHAPTGILTSGNATGCAVFGNIVGSGVTTGVKGQGLVASGVANTLVPTPAVIDIVPYVSALTAGQDYAATISAVTTANPDSVIDLRGLPSKVYLNSPMIIPAAFLLTAVANASGGNTVYTGTFPAASMASACLTPPCSITIAGFLTGANNGAFNIVSSTATTLTVANASGVAGTCPTNCTNATSSATRAAGDQFTGTLMLGNTVFFINNVTGLQTFGGGVNVEGNGRTNNGIGTSTDSTSIPYSPGTGTDFELCSTHDTLVADYSGAGSQCGGTPYTAALTADGVNYPAIITMNGYLASAGAVGVIGSTQFASRITGISVGCGMQANAVGFANASSQEGSKFDNFYWHDCTSTANIGLDLGMGTGGAQNFWATDCQGSTIAGKTNVTSAVGIRVFASTGNGLPSGILRCSVVNNVGSNNPNYGFEYVGGAQNVGEFILGMSHFESASICGMCVGVATVKGVDQGGAANGLLILDDNCGPGFSTGATTGCVRVFSTGNLSGALATNLQVLGTGETGGANSAPTNLIADDNNTVIPLATKFVVRYETDGTVTGGKVISDTSGTNGTVFLGTATATRLISNIATGTAPLGVTSTTAVPNLNVSQLLGQTWAAPGTIGGTTPGPGSFTTGQFSTSVSGKTVLTASNCTSGASPAACASAASGSVAVPAGTNATLQVNTTAVTANSVILLQSDETLGTKLTVTCNTTLASVIVEPVVTTRTGGSSFTITISGATTTNPVCLNYLIVN